MDGTTNLVHLDTRQTPNVVVTEGAEKPTSLKRDESEKESDLTVDRQTTSTAEVQMEDVVTLVSSELREASKQTLDSSMAANKDDISEAPSEIKEDALSDAHSSVASPAQSSSGRVDLDTRPAATDSSLQSAKGMRLQSPLSAPAAEPERAHPNDSKEQTEAPGLGLEPDLSQKAEEGSRDPADAADSSARAEPSPHSSSPATQEHDLDLRSISLDTSGEGQSSSSETNPPRRTSAARPQPANAEAARLLALRGLRRILESCTSRKYAETVSCCRRAIEKLEVGSEPDNPEVVEAIKKASRCGKIAAADIALETLHRLLAYGYLDPLRGAALETEQFESLIETACSCIDTKDEGVYIRLTQVLLASATSTLYGLHQTILLAAVRTLYNIYLSSKASATQTTARAAIIQVVNVVFGPLRNAPIPADTVLVADALESPAILAGATLVHREYRKHSTSSPDEGLERPESPRSQSSTQAVPRPQLDLEPIEQCQKDAYLLFRALCKLASKRISESSNLPTESLPVRSRLLALQLIRDIIDACGSALLQHERFVFALREYLTPTILQNCMIQNQSVLHTALQLFEKMLQLYRAVLKLEIAALFHAVVFRFLESPTVASWQRWRIYETIQVLAKDQQLLMDLFLNYDCDMHSPKLFERLVDDLCRIAIAALHVGGARKFTAADRRACLSILATMLHSLKEWSQPLVDARRQLGVDDGDMFQALASPTMPASATAQEAETTTERPAQSDGAAEAMLTSRSGSAPTLSNGRLSSGTERSLLESLRRKRELLEVVERFHRSAEDGLQYAASKGMVDLSDPSSVARFLRHHPGLDRHQIGEYLGGGDAFQIKVMHAFTDLAELSNLRIDAALRKHLATFHLPGEAQKIDRIAEKFAQRYCACNPTLFASADTAYILAYSIIMLNTDLHNPHIRRKMTLEDFIRNNRGINDGADLPRELLTDIYRSIQMEELRLTDAGAGAWGIHDFRYPTAMYSGEQQRAALFKEESVRLLAQTRELFAQRHRETQALSSSQSLANAEDETSERPTSTTTTDAYATSSEVYYTANNVGHVRLMLEVSWQPILASLSQILENTPDTDRELIVQCIDGFSIAVQIASLFEMDTERQALASALAKFTKLHALPEIRSKNVDCIRILLKIAIEGGDTLGETWVDVLRAVSLLERYRSLFSPRRSGPPSRRPAGNELPSTDDDALVGTTRSRPGTASGSRSPTVSLEDPANSSTHPLGDLRLPDPSDDQSTNHRWSKVGLHPQADHAPDPGMDQIPPAVREQLVEIFQSADLERVFTQTTTLSAAAMLDFMEALCRVAFEELELPDKPRFFCLGQIVGVAHLNMDRIRLEWSRIWRHIAFFLESCLPPSRPALVGRMALNALFEMARKFLEKEELSNFNFQREVLRPLERCFELTSRESLRLHSVTIAEALIRKHSLHMRSGWKSVFSVLQRAADDRSEKVVERAFSCLDYIVRTYFGEVPEVFVDALHTLAVFAVNRVSTSCATRAVEHIGVRAPAMVAEQRTGLGHHDQDLGRLWFPILTALANVSADGREVLRAYATELLFRSLLEYGGAFTTEFWVLVFRGVLAPIFDDLHHLPGGDRFEQPLAEETTNSQSWAQTTGAGALHGLMMVFEAHHESMRPLFQDMLAVLRTWICQENESICREGMSCLQRFVDQAAHWMSDHEWDNVVAFLNELVLAMLPAEITREGSIARSMSNSKMTNEEADTISFSAHGDPRGPDRSQTHEAATTEHPEADISNEDVEAQVVSSLQPHETPHGTLNFSKGTLEAGRRPSLASNDQTSPKLLGNNAEPDDRPDLAASKERQESRQLRQATFMAIRCKCVVQLLLIELVRDLVREHYERLLVDHVLALADAVHRSFRFAQHFNADLSLRFDLWRAGFMSQVPNLFRQDTTGRMVYLRILFRLLNDSRSEYRSRALEPLLELASETLDHFNRRASSKFSSSDEDANDTLQASVDHAATPSIEEQRELNAYEPVVAFLLEHMARASDAIFEQIVAKLYEHFVTLIRTAESTDVRTRLSLIFQRLGSTLASGRAAEP
jgi:brefeldin A-inhibited guanine nucleotide-exchange protein